MDIMYSYFIFQVFSLEISNDCGFTFWQKNDHPNRGYKSATENL